MSHESRKEMHADLQERIESAQGVADDIQRERDSLRAAIAESQAREAVLREALEETRKDIANCAVNNVVWPNTQRLISEALHNTSDSSREFVDRIRAEVAKDLMSILFLECQPNNGALFSKVDDEIRALLKGTKDE